MEYNKDIISRFKEWIDAVEDSSFNLFLFSNQNILLENIIDSLSKSKINAIYLLDNQKYSNPGLNIFRKHNGKVFTTSKYFMNDGLKIYCFLDFNNTDFIGDNTNDKYENSVEQRETFRKFCKEIFIINYIGADINRGYFKLKKQDKFHLILERSKWAVISQECYKPTSLDVIERYGLFSKELSIGWVNEIKNFIRSFYLLLLEDESEEVRNECIEHVLSEDSMLVWQKAFTHITVDVYVNNDSFEHLGDRLIVTDAARYIHERFPDISSNEATNFQNYYFSAKIQQILSKDLDLFKRLLKKCLRDTPKSHTDIFESFLAANTVVFNNKPDISIILNQKIIYTICDSFSFNVSVSDFKTSADFINTTNNEHGVYTKITFVSSETVYDQERGITGEKIVPVISKELYELYYKKDLENGKVNINGNLCSIPNIQRFYFSNEMELADVEFLLFDDIKNIYELNNFVPESFNEDSIFNFIRVKDKQFYLDILLKLKNFFGDNASLSNLKFLVDKKQGFIILYYDIKNQLKKTKEYGKRMDSLYNKEIKKPEANPHIQTSYFHTDEHSSFYKNEQITTLQMSKINALFSFMSSYNG